MPIPVKIVDSKSEVKVKPKSNSSVKVESDCETQAKRVEALIDKERKERIAADEDLQHQIDNLGNIQLDFTDDEGELITVEQTGEQIRLKTICLKHIAS